MNNLLKTQNDFQHFLMQGGNDIKAMIIGTEKVTAETRLDIYRNAYESRLIDALTSNYPILQAYLGDDYFIEMACGYINKHPSLYRSIRWYGDQLALYLNHHQQWCNYPYLAELAELEWKMTLVFDAADGPVIHIEDVSRIPPEAWVEMRLHAHPTIHRIDTFWNVIDIWQAISEEQDTPEPLRNENVTAWILWRNELDNRYCSLSTEEAWAIDALLKRMTFGEICEGLCQWVPENEAGMYAASLLKSWIQSGFITEIILN